MSATFRPANIWYVSKDVVSTPTGGPIHPYPTISAALAQVNALPASAGSQTIVVYPGTYVENLTITRGYVNITSFAPSQNSNVVTTLVGNVLVNITTNGNLYANQVQLSGFAIAQPASQGESLAAITDVSTVQHSLLIARCQISGRNRLISHAPATSDSRFYLEDSELYQLSNAVTIPLSLVLHSVGAAILYRTNITASKNATLLDVSDTGTVWSCSLCNFQNTTTEIVAQPLTRFASSVAFPTPVALCAFTYTNFSPGVRPASSAGVSFGGSTGQILILTQCYFTLLGTSLTGDAVNVDPGAAAPQVYTNNCFAFPNTAYYVNAPALKLLPVVTNA